MKKYILIMTLSSLFWVSIPVLLQSCVGVDNVDLPIIGERIETVSLPLPLIPDQTYPVMVTYFDKYGIEKEVPFEWSSSNPSVATISNKGVIIPLTPGKTNISVSFQGFNRSVGEVIVVNNKRIEISKTIELPFYPNQKRQLTATYFDALGVQQNVPLVWSTSNANVASVNDKGEVASLAVGKGKIQPSYSNFKGPEVEIEVTSGEKIETSSIQMALLPGQSRQLSSTYYNVSGVKTDVPLSWTSTQPAIATVSNTGVVKAITNGQTIIQSSFQSFLGPAINVAVINDLDSVASVQITTTSTALFANDKIQLAATVKNISGQILTNKSVEWISEDHTILSINSTGIVTALAKGTARIFAKSGGIKSDALTLSVSERIDLNAISSIVVTAPKTALLSGETWQFGVTVKNATGQTLNGKTLEWISGNSGVAIVNNSGNIIATGAGSTGIYARSEGITSNTITIIVSVLGGSKTSTFTKAGGYEAAGTAMLSINNGDLTLDLGSDFKTSFALGTFIYLSNSTNGATVRASALEVSQVTTNGAKTFNISKVKSNVTINDYKYVVILCKPASVTFGYAEPK